MSVKHEISMNQPQMLIMNVSIGVGPFCSFTRWVPVTEPKSPGLVTIVFLCRARFPSPNILFSHQNINHFRTNAPSYYTFLTVFLSFMIPASWVFASTNNLAGSPLSKRCEQFIHLRGIILLIFFIFLHVNNIQNIC